MVKLTTTLFLILLCMVLLLSLTACGGNKPTESGEGTGFTTTSTTSGETVSNSSATTGGTAGGESTTGTESTATKTAAVTTGTRPTAGQTGTSKTQKTTAVTTAGTTQSLEGIEIGLISPKQGSKQWLGNDDIEEWLTAATPGRSGLYATGKDIYFLDECVLKWSCNGTPQGYTVDIATTSDLKDALTLSCVAPELVLEEPYTGVTYYWRVTAQFSGGTVVSDVFCFTVEEAPRTVRIEGVSNTRDIGWWSTESGGRIRKGMVYRAGSLDGITTVGKRQALSLLGLKTDLDLRRRGEGTAGLKSPIDPALNYVNVSGSYYTDENIGVHTAAGQAALREEFAVLADP
ncbi:MAG: tyrosine-protein phosphatase, partial [Clostridia bacterium]|nr:tyrosine-protein phosphatase [Clostridia bacterium]